MMALQVRNMTGKGQRVDTSLLEGQISMLAHFFTRYFASGEVPGPSGSGALTSPTYRAYQCSDDWIVISAFNQKMWHGLCATLEKPEWLVDPRFIDPKSRATNRPTLIPMIAEVIQKQPIEYWLAKLKQNEVPCSPINKIDKVVVQPQVLESKMIEELELTGLGMMKMAGLPIKFSDTPGTVRRPAPRLGQHTEEILLETGRSPADIAALASKGSIGLDKGWIKISA